MLIRILDEKHIFLYFHAVNVIHEHETYEFISFKFI